MDTKFMSKKRIHPTAIVAEEAVIADHVQIGPYSIIGPHVKIDTGTWINNHVVIEGHTSIGERCQIFSGACLGTDPQDKKYQKTRCYLDIGSDNIIREYVTIHPGSTEDARTVIGDRNLLMIGCHIAHDCHLGNEIAIANNTGLSGHVKVEDQAVISGIVGIHQFVRVGKLSMIGGVSKVVKDVPPFSICDGHPAVFCGLNSVGLKRAGISSKDALQIKKALKILFASGLIFSNAVKKIKSEFPSHRDIQHLLAFAEESERGLPRGFGKSEE